MVEHAIPHKEKANVQDIDKMDRFRGYGKFDKLQPMAAQKGIWE